MEFTKQTPEEVKDWLKANQLAFPASWTLYQVAEESRRRYLAKKWRSEIHAVRSVTHWAGYKLATSREFSAQSWDWIAGSGPYTPQNHYFRLSSILGPAYAQGPAWRTTEQERIAILSEVGDKARDLIRILDTERMLDISMREVVAHNPEMQPLVDLEFEATTDSMRRAHQVNANRRDGTDSALPPVRLDGLHRGPRLSDYLERLLAKILGDTRVAIPSAMFSGLFDNEGAGLSSDQNDGDRPPQEILEAAGILQPMRRPLDPGLLRAGGAFGGYPTQLTSLRSAVIRAFPEAIFDRIAAPPRSTPASVIEAACMAWFEESPTQKEINAMIKPGRDALEAGMMRAVAAQERHEASLQEWRKAGLSEAEIHRRELDQFLEGD